MLWSYKGITVSAPQLATLGRLSNREPRRRRQYLDLNRKACPVTCWVNYHSIWLDSDASRSTRASIGEYIISEEPQGVLETTLYGDESTPVKYIIIQSLGLFYIFSTLKLNNSKTTYHIFKKLTFLKTRDKTTSNKKITPTPLWGELGE